jgi:hypothetical protein
LSVSGGYSLIRASLLFCLLLFGAASNGMYGQSTFATILGTVKDPSGKVAPAASILLTNNATAASRSEVANPSGEFIFSNVEPGSYRMSVSALGFRKSEYPQIELLARETKRFEVGLELATQTQTIEVQDTFGAAISTDTSNLAQTKTGRELVDLPVAITSRGLGSTSPISTLTTQPGVQTDASGNISVGGAKPSLLSTSLDGISSMAVRSSAPINELFPSFNSIAEIRVSQTNNNAEFGGVSDITTISKSGGNTYHGGVFENHQNAAFDARNPFSARVPKLIMNDFGAFVGGPISVPKLYSGHDKTFFFASYEGLRLPRETVVSQSVPSLGLRSGNLSSYSKPVYAPGTNQPYAGNIIPSSQISPVALNALRYLYPLPNAGAPNAIANNFVENFPAPITSNQGDMRVDQNITSKQTAYARFTYKNRQVVNAPGTGSINGSAALGPFSQPEIDYGLTGAYNYVITPALINELRIGFNGNHTATSFGIPGTTIANQIGIPNLPSIPSSAAVPNFQIAGFQQTGGTASSITRNNTIQFLDNLTWIKNSHTLKFGGDYRYLTGYGSNVFASTRLGAYIFDGSVTGSIGAANAYIGNPYAAFLLGIPDETQLASVIQPNMEAYAGHYAFYVQDDWKVNSRLTLNYGLRWEYHPMFKDHLLNVTNFLPDYVSVVNGQTVNGAVTVPNTQSLSILNKGFADSISPTPILTAQQAGIPESMRYSQKTSFAPRVGFAWRPFGNDKTVIRGGYGKYIQSLLGGLVNAQWGVHTTDYGLYVQSLNGGRPSLTFPYPFPANLAIPGSQDFLQAQAVNYRDPYVQEWNLTIERDLGFGTALRVSYEGSHGSDLSTTVDFNQVPFNTAGYAVAKAGERFPLWGKVQAIQNGAWSNYQALTVEANKRFAKGLQFQTSYMFAKNLANEAGVAPTSFVGENGSLVSDRFNLGLDYGNVAYTRRNRFLTTFLYELPFGRKGSLFTVANGLVDSLIGGWEVAGVLLFQTGPFLTITAPGADPSGTNFPLVCGCAGRADTVAGVSMYPTTQTRSAWLNASAFAVPAKNIGRFGDSAVGAAVAPGTQAVSLSLIKTIRFTEAARLQIGGEASNLLNHANYAPPNTSLNTSAFGTISNVQSAEGAGPRALQVTARFNF